MNKLFVIHFQPLEKYPPVMNLLRYLARNNQQHTEIHVITTKALKHQPFIESEISIHRPGGWHSQMSTLRRTWLYGSFNMSALWLLIRHNPYKVFYFETMSAFAPGLYKKYINRSSELFIHFHEYTSPEEYQTTAFMPRWIHRFERTFFNKARWISHTNQERLNLFLKDINHKSNGKVAVLENWPPASWIINVPKIRKNSSTAFVYVGALSVDTMFVREWALFISKYPEKYSWHIYSDNYSDDTLSWLRGLQASNILFHGAVSYDNLPETLKKYDVGIILYKGHIPNYIFNAPNKLFEYFACGLDVLFPFTMTGCNAYVTNNTFPKIVPLNFDALQIDDVDQAVDRTDLLFRPSEYYYEKRLPEITSLLLNDHG